MIPLVDRARADAATLAALADVVREHSSLARVVQWSLAQGADRALVDVVVQDEFTHDVVLRWSDALYLVYDAT
ncbi:MAG: hypothetical protein R3A48_01220 [Polyangiales bacterium]